MKPLHEKRAEAIERNNAWRALSPEAQLEALALRRGHSARQIARIKAVNPVSVAVPLPPAVPEGVEKKRHKKGRRAPQHQNKPN